VRVASFNIQHGRLPSGEVDTLVAAQACAVLGADVLALQEVDLWRSRSHRADQAAVIAGVCGMAHVFGRADRRLLRGAYGNALLVRGRVSDSDAVSLPRAPAAAPRTALLATAHLDGVALSVVATHLSVRGVESEPQLRAALAALSSRPRPWLLVGDLNRGPGQVAALVAGFGLALVDTAMPTFPAHEPRARIDHVCFAGLDPGPVEVRELPVSDHRAVVADLFVP
jgi:endonuclease/exonuclease/phosphatase family metal-dependent hydrolase